MIRFENDLIYIRILYNHKSMCIVADSVKDVSKTKIASFHTAYTLDGGKNIIPSQLVVYSADVDSNTDTNAFILPIYNPGNDHKKIIPLDFSNMPDFFSNVQNVYDRWFPRQILKSQSYSMNSTNSYSENLLEVHKVGDYKFSIMPSKIDFNRLNRSQLNVNPLAKKSIDAHTNDYSFIVYQFFQKGKIEITPFAYLCEPYREHAMIIPTIHGHPHDDLPIIGLYNPTMYDNYGSVNSHDSYNSYGSEFENSASFDHEIYCLVKNPSEQNIVTKKDIVDMDKLLKPITNDYMNRNIKIYCPKSFIPNKININGQKANRNILIKADGYSFIYDLTFDTQIHKY